MAPRFDFDSLPRCGGWAKSSGKPCLQPGTKQNGRCHWHNGKAKKGPKKVSEEGRHAQKLASWKHGRRSKEAVEENRMIRKFMKGGYEFLEAI